MGKVFKWIGIVFVVFIGLGIVGAAMGGGSPSDTTSSEVKGVTEKKDEPQVPAEYKSALGKATTYSKTMNMSKKGVYNQLTSTIEGFSAEAAQYAIDNVQADWNANALVKAKSYQNNMSMSPAAIRDQLTSEYGEQFTAAEAEYAIANLNK
jgi:hypothetical protein